MYKKSITLLSTLLFIGGILNAQVSLERQVIGAAGDYVSTANLKVSATVGEATVTTLITGQVILTQGFQQPLENEITDLEDLSIVVDYKVYPNPTTDQLFVEVTRTQPAEIQLELFDLAGRSFPNLKQALQGSGTSRTSISFQALPEGTYLLSFKDAAGKVLVSHRVQKLH